MRTLDRRLELRIVLLVAACGRAPTTVSEAPIPVAQAPGGGGLYTLGSINGGATFPLLVDTGTPLSAHHADSGSPRFAAETLQLFDASGVKRAEFPDVSVLE